MNLACGGSEKLHEPPKCDTSEQMMLENGADRLPGGRVARNLQFAKTMQYL